MTDYLDALWAAHEPSDPDDPTWCRDCLDWGCEIRPLVAALRAVEGRCEEWLTTTTHYSHAEVILDLIRNALGEQL